MKRAILMLLVLACVHGCCNAPVGMAPATRLGVTHIVVCWLKNPGNMDERRKLMDESHGLAEIPGVIGVWAGPVLPSTRPAVDATFDVAIVMRFKDEAALAGYAANPIHLAAVERTLKPLVAKYVVYDFRE